MAEYAESPGTSEPHGTRSTDSAEFVLVSGVEDLRSSQKIVLDALDKIETKTHIYDSAMNVMEKSIRAQRRLVQAGTCMAIIAAPAVLSTACRAFLPDRRHRDPLTGHLSLWQAAIREFVEEVVPLVTVFMAPIFVRACAELMAAQDKLSESAGTLAVLRHLHRRKYEKKTDLQEPDEWITDEEDAVEDGEMVEDTETEIAAAFAAMVKADTVFQEGKKEATVTEAHPSDVVDEEDKDVENEMDLVD